MFETRSLFYKAEKVNEAANKMEGECPHIGFLQRLYQQSKQVSQIIAYIWRWADENNEKYAEQKRVANLLRTYFEHPTSDQGLKEGKNADHLKKLFGANPNQPLETVDESDPAYLLKQVFFPQGNPPDEYIFPIFDKCELGEKNPSLGYLFEVTYSSFIGQILDADNNAPELFKMIIPYPPEPSWGNATLNADDLSDWISNRKPGKYFADNPYIPTTCS
ncbi:MAG: hypothetical protein ACOVOV_10295 [Dolichospermum sp.]|jgi:hypothetical protein|uniref:hypothetical protein n=1 Tax=unclassified Microcystis TaxID=2643300 RepID=UPI000E39B58F|nr:MULTISPECIES: hypothetical protein [unclassified Microcystis]REJ49786.1 MAG: hypothetical protein DWQ53_02525 [Microcystis flos-aquae DF17]MCA2667273.1 hypothetical protein [Microcystis sp. M045S2]MCA2712207.1 hypothetical protein [Microcystis sp. M172S2]MCA2803919.1 hypothetical protein [Microcystis sp. M114S2]MCA2834720.1 hypothetical protein [Microcystis sp. M007S1]